MFRWVAAVGSGLGSAAVTGFLFWWINSLHQVNGVGLLQRQDWPVSSFWVWLGCGFVLGVIGRFVGVTKRASHNRSTRELAEELGREFVESYFLPPGAESLPLFAGWSNGRSAMISRQDKLPVALFDYTTVTRGSESDSVREGTAVLLPVDDLVAFDLRPRKLVPRVLGWAGPEGLTFDPAAADGTDAETVRRFTELFYLAAVDPLTLIGTLSEYSPPEPADKEEAIRQLFTPAVMAVLNRYPAYAIQSRPGFLAVWRGSGVLPDRKRTELWDAALDLRGLLTTPPKGAVRPVASGRVATDVNRQARKLRNSLVGGVIGLFAGFILASMAMSVVFFRQARAQGPGLGFLMLPVLFFGLTMVGAAVGARIRSRLPLRNLPPDPAEEPGQRMVRNRVTGCGVLVGLVGGFLGGFVVLEASRLLFQWKLDDFGLEGALFFGSIFGGALLGAVICGMVVNRLYGRLQRGKHSRKA
jgi:hypothetical protein